MDGCAVERQRLPKSPALWWTSCGGSGKDFARSGCSGKSMSCSSPKGAELKAAQSGSARQCVVFDCAELRLRMASPPTLSALGYSVGELSRLTFLDLLPDVSERAWRRLARRLTANEGREFEFETRLRRKDGSDFVARLRLSSLNGADGELQFLATIDGSIDAAGTKVGRRLDAALLHSVIDTAPDAIITIEERWPDPQLQPGLRAAVRLPGRGSHRPERHRADARALPDRARRLSRSGT